MSAHTQPIPQRLAIAARDVLGTSSMRVVLSALILLSLALHEGWPNAWKFFFAVFAVELAARLLIYTQLRDQEATRRRRLLEATTLCLDFLALLSFLPHGVPGLQYARFLRLFLLLGYWGATVRTLWHLTTRPERKMQLAMLAASVTLFSFVSAAVLSELKPPIDELGLTTEPDFVDLVWWSFEQVQDPGNLVKSVSKSGLWILSIALTIAGLFLISFLIGIGTTVVEELVEAGRNRALGLRGHSVLVNATEHTHFFLDQVIDYYQKQVKRPRWMVLGELEERQSFSEESRYRSIHYRRGTPYHHEDLARVDAKDAKRIVIVADAKSASPDAATVSAVLSTRKMNSRALIYAEAYDEKHTTAILAAGGRRTTVVPTEHLLALTIANVVVMPEGYQIFEEFLTARGNEIYTYVYLPQDRTPGPLATAAEYDELLRYAYDVHGCVLLGLGLGPVAANQEAAVDAFANVEFKLGPATVSPRLLGHPIAGIAGIGARFESVRALALALPAQIGAYKPSVRVRERADLPTVKVKRRTDESAQILICGFRQRTPLLLEHLVDFLPSAAIYVMVHGEQNLKEARKLMREAGRSIQRFGDEHGPAPAFRGTFDESALDTFAYRRAGQEPAAARVHLMEGDWVSREVLLEPRANGYDFRRVCSVIFKSDENADADPDARTVMAVMKLHNLQRSQEFRSQMHPDLHLTVEMVDVLKADLLVQRFGTPESDFEIPIDVVPVEKMRNTLLFQATVVPGFSSIVMEVFSRWNLYLYAVEFSEAPGEGVVHFGELLWTLYRRHRVVLVAIEVVDQAGKLQYRTAPGDAAEATFDPRSLRSLFVIGLPLDESGPVG